MLDILIIMPFVHERDGLRSILQTLKEQLTAINQHADKPLRVEIVCVNNSTETVKPADIFPSGEIFHLLQESDAVGSPYSARNRGIEFKKAQVYLFLDATCHPDQGWMEQLVAHYRRGFDLLAANVRLYSKMSPTPTGMLYDAINGVDNERSIHEKGGACTACLAADKRVIEAIGPFEEGVRSGGDIAWTRKASKHNFSLIFERQWRVLKPARPTRKVIAKQWRVSEALPRLMTTGREYTALIVKKVLLMWLPPKPGFLLEKARRRGFDLNAWSLTKLVCFGWYLRVVTGVAICAGLLKGQRA